MATLSRDGTTLYYEDHGEGPAILLTHGFSATSQMWRPQIPALTAKYRVVTWDMRGHGYTGSPEDPSAYSEAATTADMAALLDHLGIETAVIGGLSLGGYMSLAFYADYVARCEALLIIDTGPGFKRDEAREGWNRTALATAAAIDADGAGALAGGSAERASAHHESYAGLARAARGMLTQQNARVITSLPDIAVPSLVLVGADDAPFLAATDYMAAKIPAAHKVVIPNAGHAANLDQPEAFNEAVLSFLASTN